MKTTSVQESIVHLLKKGAKSSDPRRFIVRMFGGPVSNTVDVDLVWKMREVYMNQSADDLLKKHQDRRKAYFGSQGVQNA